MSPASPAADREILISRLASSGQWERVLEVARDGLSEDPDSAATHKYAARALISLDREPEAQVHLEKLLAARPDDSEAHRMMSAVHFHQLRFGAADEAIKQAIALDPQNSNHWYHLAWMCHRQNDLAAGQKWAAKARELSPNDPEVLNLYALCLGRGPEQAVLLREVLALDPENALAHNNLGACYLELDEDFARAEQCFRQALALKPTLALARRNLFVTLKHRDPVYRVLCAPRDFLLKIRSSLFGEKRNNVGAAALGMLVWLVLFRFVLGGLILWFGLVWPMLKVYEFLVVGDIRKQAGESGARRGGFLGYRRWPLAVRLTVFGAALVGFWCTIAFLVRALDKPRNAETASSTLGFFASIGAVLLVGYFARKWVKTLIERYHAWQRGRRLKNLRSSSHE